MFQSSNLIILTITQKCNMNCKYCFEGDKSNLSSEIMSFSTFSSIVDSICNDYILYKDIRESQRYELLFHGGEPTLLPYEQFEKFLEYGTRKFKENGVPYYFSIQTNALLLDKKLQNLFKEYSVHIGVSLDALTNNMRSSSVDTEKIVQNIESAIENENSLGMVSVATKENIDYIPNFVKGLFKNFSIIKINPCQNSVKGIDIEPTAESIFKNIFLVNIENFKKTGKFLDSHIEFIVLAFIIYTMFNSNLTSKSTCSFKDCGGGSNLITILPNGVVHCCDKFRGDETFFNDKIQDIRDYSFLSLSQFNKTLSLSNFYRPVHINLKCDSCIYEPICHRPCPTLSYKYFGEKVFSDEHCKYVKMCYHYLQENLSDILDAYIDLRCGYINLNTSNSPGYRILSVKKRDIANISYNVSIINDREFKIKRKGR